MKLYILVVSVQGMQTIINVANATETQQQIYLLQLQIRDCTQKLQQPNLGQVFKVIIRIPRGIGGFCIADFSEFDFGSRELSEVSGFFVFSHIRMICCFRLGQVI